MPDAHLIPAFLGEITEDVMAGHDETGRQPQASLRCSLFGLERFPRELQVFVRHESRLPKTSNFVCSCSDPSPVAHLMAIPHRPESVSWFGSIDHLQGSRVVGSRTTVQAGANNVKYSVSMLQICWSYAKRPPSKHCSSLDQLAAR